MPNKRTLVAGIGNILLQDDGFGPEVIRKLRSKVLPPEVETEDFGISSIKLTHKLLEGYDLLIIVDISKRGEKPGTVYLIEIDPSEEGRDSSVHSPMQSGLSGHTMSSADMLSQIRLLKAWPKEVLLVCCEPLLCEDYSIGLSEPVQNSVDKAVEIIELIIAKEIGSTKQSTV